MRGQIRLAERQQLLVGKGLSLVQVTAIAYCEVRDDLARDESRTDDMKYAWLSSGKVHMPPIDFVSLFPEMIGTGGVPEAIEEDYEGDLQEGDRLIFEEQPQMTQAEIEAELRELMSGAGMTANGGDMYG